MMIAAHAGANPRHRIDQFHIDLDTDRAQLRGDYRAELRIEQPALCLRIFKSNRDAGLLLFAGLLVDAVMRAQG